MVKNENTVVSFVEFFELHINGVTKRGRGTYSQSRVEFVGLLENQESLKFAKWERTGMKRFVE